MIIQILVHWHKSLKNAILANLLISSIICPMTLNEKIIADIQTLNSPTILSQIFEFVQLMKRSELAQNTQVSASRFPKLITDEEAQELQAIINQEFSHIEGEWS
jgi:hypothetical protein